MVDTSKEQILRSKFPIQGDCMIRYFLPWVAALSLIASVSDASAQRVPHYSRTPTVSPYINLFRGNTGGSNSYFSFVRPIQNQLRFNQEQDIRNRHLTQQIQINEQMLSDPLMEAGRPLLGPGTLMMRPNASSLGQPTAAASYLNYLHFYRMPAIGGRGRRLR